mmetsp:Transcript_25684/g.31640  ORF Transcript_25684/g.31640 Transcript_25684/m.31640 type:complete len:184 (-) Transcript_25684:224-775(-)
MFSGMKAHILLRKDVDVYNSPLFKETDLFFCPKSLFAQVWLQRNEDTIFITGFVVGEAREKILSSSVSAEDLFLDQLQRIFQTESGNIIFIESKPSCSAFDLYDWSSDEFIGGLYSSPSINAGWHTINECRTPLTCRDDLRNSIVERIFFAGEHTNISTCATVQSAVESGLVAAEQVLQSLSK